MNENKTSDKIEKSTDVAAAAATDSSSNRDFIVLDDSVNETGAIQSHDNEIEIIKESTCCPLCFEIVDSSLEAHFAFKHKELDCPFCSLIFDTDEQLASHVNSAHYAETAHQNDPETTEVISHQANGELVLECPICSFKVKDREWLEIHVDSHFNPTNPPDSDIRQSGSSSSQFADIPTTSRNAAHSSSPNDPNEDMDYQLALSVQEEEQRRSSESTTTTATKSNLASKKMDPFKSQLQERQRNEALKFKLSKGMLFFLAVFIFHLFCFQNLN
jgi:uncharacterized C2H2 Zn-finger protein